MSSLDPGQIIRRAAALTAPDEPTQTGTISTCEVS